ncbi:DUF805 domain-containing protein [Chthonobacter rhizosphaerae]|uniref:DUF805 domain-containing protein n=1 Tax=Chthonobacter rhizosphaerae TaxID=2735553 RepID=UPI0015EEE7E8|nr:DUF805 domain-containing protein [Chthonobacter rhizosphaerae]
MTATEVLFGFRGRVSRGLFNAGMLMLAAVAALQEVLVFELAPAMLPRGFLPMAHLYGIVFAGAVGLIAFSALAVKRLHDLDRSGGALVAMVIGPVLVLAIEALAGPAPLAHYAALAVLAWAITDLALMPGTDGPNRFGEDPRARLAA